MKKVTFLLIISMFSLTIYSKSAQAKLTVQEERFVQTITQDFIISHSLNLNGYSFFDPRDIAPNKDNLTTEEKSLTNILTGIAKEQNFMDCSPIFYIDKQKNRGYVLEKRLSGMNNLLTLSYDNTSQSWNVTNKIEKMGKDIVDLGLVKSAN